MAVTASRAKGGFYIGVTCPGCGGRLELQEDFFVLKCTHCGSILRVAMPDLPPAYIIESKKQKREVRFKLDRHLKEQGLPLTRSDFKFEKIYYPYWKVDALEVKTRGENINRTRTRKAVKVFSAEIDTMGISQMSQIMTACVSGGYDEPEPQSSDMSVNLVPFHVNQIAGPVIEGIPYSIGMRTSYMKMLPYTQDEIDEDFRFVPVMKPWDTVLDQLRGRLPRDGMINADPNYIPGRRLVRPSGSVVYFPYFICSCGARRFMVDGLNGRVVHESRLRGDEEPDNWSDPHLEFGKLSVDFHRCPTCGVDLPLTQSHVYICHNCDSVVCLDKENPLDNGMSHAPGSTNPHDPMFPFWVFKLHRKTAAQIARLSVTGEAPRHIVIPAFRIANFKVTRRLTQRFSAAFPQFEREPVESFNKNFRPVDIGLSEAKTLAEMCLYCEKAAKEPNISPDSIEIKPRSTELFYAPFHAENYFYVDSIMQAVTFAKNTVAE